MTKNFMIISFLSVLMIGCTDLPEFSCPDGTALQKIESAENNTRILTCTNVTTTANGTESNVTGESLWKQSGSDIYYDEGNVKVNNTFIIGDRIEASAGDIIRVNNLDFFRANIGQRSVVIGDTNTNVDSHQVTALGYWAGRNAGSNFVAIGTRAGEGATSGFFAMGVLSGFTSTTDFVAIGHNAGQSSVRRYVAIGNSAGQQSGTDYVSLGRESGRSSGDRYTAIGMLSGRESGNDFVSIGYQAGRRVGNNFVSIGRDAGSQLSGTAPLNANNFIALGRLASVDKDNQFVVGSATYEINEMKLGVGSGRSSLLFANTTGVGINNDNPQTQLHVVGNTSIEGNLGIGTTNPSYPLHIIGSEGADEISAYFSNNISATGFIERTSVYDKSKGSALNLIRSSDELKTDGKIDHSKFYGYTTWTTTETDMSRPVIQIKEEEECLYEYIKNEKKRDVEDDDEIEIRTCTIIEKQITTYPYEINVTNKGVNIGMEIELLREAMYEVIQENKYLKSELNNVNQRINEFEQVKMK